MNLTAWAIYNCYWSNKSPIFEQIWNFHHRFIVLHFFLILRKTVYSDFRILERSVALTATEPLRTYSVIVNGTWLLNMLVKLFWGISMKPIFLVVNINGIYECMKFQLQIFTTFKFVRNKFQNCWNNIDWIQLLLAKQFLVQGKHNQNPTTYTPQSD